MDGCSGGLLDHVTARNVFSVAAHTHSLLFYTPLSIATIECSMHFCFVVGCIEILHEFVRSVSPSGHKGN